MDLSGVALQLVIRKPWEDCSGYVMWMSTQCRALVVGQHDDEDKEVHCHVMILDPKVGDEAMRKQKKKHHIDGKHSSTTSVVHDGPSKGEPYSFDKLGPYALKANSKNLKMVTQNITQETIDRWLREWVDPKKQQVALQGDVFVKQGNKQHTYDSKFSIVQEIVAKIAKYDHLPNRVLVETVREVLLKHEQIMGMYKVIDICDAVMMYSGKHCNTWKNAAVQFLDKRYA